MTEVERACALLLLVTKHAADRTGDTDVMELLVSTRKLSGQIAIVSDRLRRRGVR
jgi:hypothetical protein